MNCSDPSVWPDISDHFHRHLCNSCGMFTFHKGKRAECIDDDGQFQCELCKEVDLAELPRCIP